LSFPWIFAAAAAAGAMLWRDRHVRRLESELRSRLPMGESGVARGAEAIRLEGTGTRAVLLLHGFGDTPQTLSYLADHLQRAGFTVSVPLLPGHGRTLRSFARMTSESLHATAAEEYERLRARFPRVGVVGLSMGGALAVRLAARHRELPALVLLAPYLEMPPGLRRIARAAPLWGRLLPYLRSRDPRSIRDQREIALNRGYGVLSAGALATLERIVRAASADLPWVASPTLLIQSREDNRISPHAAERAYARLGARERRLMWTEGAGHVITVDFGREAVIEETAGWLERWIENTDGEGPAAGSPPHPD
jgi:carboxylesterase